MGRVQLIRACVYLALMWAVVLVGSFAVAPRAHAQQTPIFCEEPVEQEKQREEFEPYCDLALVKEASVDGATFVDADTVDAAVQLGVDGVVTWRITVENAGTLDVHSDVQVRVTDVLPSGIVYQTHSASAGTYNLSTWMFAAGSLPATLTIQTAMPNQGTFENVATVSEFSCDGTEFYCGFFSNNGNNTDNAFAVVSAIPQVLGATTEEPQVQGAVLAATGVSSAVVVTAGMAIMTTVLYIRRHTVQSVRYQLRRSR